MKEQLLSDFEIAVWNLCHIHSGTATHLWSLKRCSRIADRLRSEYGMTDEELELVAERAEKGELLYA